jgi:hypothetical protein
MIEGDARLANIRRHATRVRQAIEMTDLRDCGNSLSDFPYCCCHHAVKLLAFHLFELGWSDLHAAVGTRNNDPNYQHAWLRSGDILVDITADQFGEGQHPVVATRHSPWHEAWKPKQEPINRANVIFWRSRGNPASDAYLRIMATMTGVVLS